MAARGCGSPDIEVLEKRGRPDGAKVHGAGGPYNGGLHGRSREATIVRMRRRSHRCSPAGSPPPARPGAGALRAATLVGCLIASACSGAARSGLPSDDAWQAALLDPADSLWQAAAPAAYTVIFETTQGAFTLEVHRDWAPRGADRFYNLVRSGFFDDSRFFRVRAGFIAQFGLPGDPAIAPHWVGNAFPDDSVRKSNVRATAAFAMTGPGTRTTQVYINLADNSRLDVQGFAPFGTVSSGMDVVDRLYAGYDEAAGGGVRAGNQGRIIAEGNAHLDRDFPLLDRLIGARIAR